MSPGPMGAALVVVLAATALAGPWLLRSAAPALVRAPRLALGVLIGVVVGWLGGLVVVGPLLAWSSSGAQLLPEPMAETCQRCLAASNPFSTSSSGNGVPAALLLAFGLLVAAVVSVGTARRSRRAFRRSRHTAAELAAAARPGRLHGVGVQVVDTDELFAFALPARHGGIFVSTGALAVLDETELAAVLAHEQAHLRQRHHLLALLVDGLTHALRWVPLLAAVRDAFGHYVEIAADHQARRTTGTAALVGALVKLGERRDGAALRVAGVLHAAGPERIVELVRPTTGVAGAVPLVGVTAGLATLVALSTAVAVPYVSAAITGC